MQTLRVIRDRDGLVEAVHHVDVAVWRDGRTTGDAQVRFLRSAAKPVQALACLLTGAADRFGFTVEEVALACASHNGEPFHIAAARSMLAKAGVAEAALLCGPHAPIHEESAAALIRAGETPRPIHNNCSGKHAAMLAACVAAGWPIEDYVAPDHPLQQLNRRNVALFSGVAADTIRIGIDGCSAPVFGIPLFGAARLIGGIAAPERLDLPSEIEKAAARSSAAMATAPEMVGGTARSDTDLMHATRGRVLSKVGAEGLWSLGVRGSGIGIAVKCRDGSSDAARRAGLEVLRRMGELDDAEWKALAPHRDPIRHNCRKLDVGRVRVEGPANSDEDETS
jgi:L-asparaginase II